MLERHKVKIVMTKTQAHSVAKAKNKDEVAKREKRTIGEIRDSKKTGEKMVYMSVPDYTSAKWAEMAGVDVAVVGDSLAMVAHGHASTIPATMDMMILHALAVRRGAPHTFSLGCMPLHTTNAYFLTSKMKIRTRRISSMRSCHKRAKLRNDACTELELAQPAGCDELGVSPHGPWVWQTVGMSHVRCPCV
jgi:Ketopantoate hydroxymethyltransferase